MKSLICSSTVLAGCLLLLAGGAFAAKPVRPDEADRIRPWSENPRYWQYRGRPVLLIGGSVEDNLFQLPNLERHLDEIAAAGGNYIRNTMSDRRDHGAEVAAFRQLPDGRYDLEGWNPEYWERFENLLRWTEERDVIVQIEMWDRFDHSREQWETDPFNPRNNINYTYAEAGFEEEYPEHPGRNKQPFFFTTPEQRHNRVVLPYQQRFVDRMLEHTLHRPHVLYCIDNETSAEEAWGAYWAGYARWRARQGGVDVFLTEMWNAWDVRSVEQARTFDRPDRYDFIDISQNNHRVGRPHWENLQWVRRHIAGLPRPINTVKTYGSDAYRYGNDRDGVERFWRHLIGGVASARFHRPPGGLGLSPMAVASLKAVRRLEDRIKLWEVEPALDLLREASENEAYLAARPGEAYALYFTDGGSVALDLADAPGWFELRWIDIGSGDWGPEERIEGGGRVRLAAPRSGHWAAALTRSP